MIIGLRCLLQDVTISQACFSLVSPIRDNSFPIMYPTNGRPRHGMFPAKKEVVVTFQARAVRYITIQYNNLSNA